jgi:hypothetical protein
MDREELFASIVDAHPDREDTVYLERRGNSYSWRIVSPDAVVTETPPNHPDVWTCFCATWPKDPTRTRALLDDLLAELESMAERTDRCRWPLRENQP